MMIWPFQTHLWEGGCRLRKNCNFDAKQGYIWKIESKASFTYYKFARGLRHSYSLFVASGYNEEKFVRLYAAFTP